MSEKKQIDAAIGRNTISAGWLAFIDAVAETEIQTETTIKAALINKTKDRK